VNYGSVCSGIEAATVAWHSLGWRAAWFAEIDKFPCAVLAYHYPQIPNVGDMTKVARAILIGQVDAPDVIVGGTPCQAYSVAGLREGLDDERGQLTLSYVRLFDAIDYVRVRRGKPPAIAVWENVPGVLSSKDNAFGCFLAGLAGESCELEPPRNAKGKAKSWPNAGCVFGPTRTIAWRVLDAQYFALAQRRSRVFVIASARKDFNPCDVLFESDGVRRDSAPRREEAKDVAGTVTSSLGRRRGMPDGGDTPGFLQPVASTGDVSHCLNAGGMGRQDFETETLITQAIGFDSRQDPVSSRHVFGALSSARPQAQAVCVTGDITHALKAEGFDASEGGTGRGQPIINACLTAGVRRLTPRECERLQGFPDDYTLVPVRGKPAADGPRYKALGNSMAVPCMAWLGQRIQMAIDSCNNINAKRAKS
jgi:DNA (cytosine-5)-methyltransferase 1